MDVADFGVEAIKCILLAVIADNLIQLKDVIKRANKHVKSDDNKTNQDRNKQE